MSTPHLLDLRSIACALGGEISGRQILAPGPGHRPQDRSLSIRIGRARRLASSSSPSRATTRSPARIMCANVSAYLNGSPATSRTGASSRCNERSSTARRWIVKRRSGRGARTIRSVSSARLQSGMREGTRGERSPRLTSTSIANSGSTTLSPAAFCDFIRPVPGGMRILARPIECLR